MNNPIKPPLPKVAIDWLEFDDPDTPGEKWRIHLNFLMSNYTCIFGQGCQGHFGVQDAYVNPDIGCCSDGAYINTKTDRDAIAARVEMLTENELSREGLAHIRKHGWLRTFQAFEDPEDWIDRDTGEVSEELKDEFNGKTKVRKGGCVFANRSDESNGKIGCAFHHLGQRLGTPDHTSIMPEVCWMAPLALRHLEEDGEKITAIVPWDSKYWGGMDEDGTHDSWMSWWCVDTADAYVSDTMLIYTMEQELRVTMGDAAYEKMVELIKLRNRNTVAPMPGQLRNDGRPLLPLLVGNRTNRRA